MKKTIQQIQGEITGIDVIVEYVNRQNACCDNSRMSSAVGRLEEVTEDGVRVSQDFVPFAGLLAGICSIKRVGNNNLIYENPAANKVYIDSDVPLSEEQMCSIKQQGRWVY